MTQVKICGINTAVAFDTAFEAGADWVGFNFFPASPRYVTSEAAAALSSRVGGGPSCVGLFVEPTLPMIASVLDVVKLDVLQIYGASDRLAAIKASFGLPIWRAVGISATSDLPTDPSCADRLLLEAKPPSGATRPGGNATAFDWSILRDWIPIAPWMLAGGLTPANVAAAVAQTGASAVDVSSGVESSKGVKDSGLIRAFIAAARTTAQPGDPVYTS
jgi:phosphoribosylanthranilate isomerase